MNQTIATVVLLILAALLILEAIVHADAPISDQLALARICVSEAGFEPSDDCAAIGAAIANGARRRHLTFQTFARAYSNRVFDVTRADARAYLAHLQPSSL